MRPDQNRRSDDSKSQSNLSRTNDSFATFEQQDPMLDTSRSGGDNSQDEFLNKYKEIEGTDQRNKYKQDFSAEFKEYQRLYTKVAAEARRFAKWRMQYRKQEKGTEQYKSLARKVVHEYQILKENEEFVKDRSRLQYLHRKLKHIKELVLEFDCRQHEIERSRTAQREKRSRLPASDEDDDGPRRSHAHRRSADLLRKQPVLSV
uniref:OCEL domain-containing protein n=1 Tax=Ciona savignyi TaxID=51511 RepID=H2Z2F7_CIOSA